MTEGLITRIGKWIDHRWESKATEAMVLERWNNLENAQIRDKVELEDKIKPLASKLQVCLEQIERVQLMQIPDVKEIADLKTRMEKIELYSGMTRKVDPTKPPIAKSAFQM
jgi:hypothetical protein